MSYIELIWCIRNAEPVRLFVCEAVKKGLPAGKRKTLAEQDGKLVHG
ncbi:hypothetical protein HHL14_32290 [Paraburkholderia sp. G-4-1-8]|uniref:Uncharacterized protein n=1 Tax=Paraburkholderia antibiotica TaxID=2728839 RepID=A0A7Y0A2U8_9BURK|nr:hypothetical protein [Paraburkholderia antibiotica]